MERIKPGPKKPQPEQADQQDSPGQEQTAGGMIKPHLAAFNKMLNQPQSATNFYSFCGVVAFRFLKNISRPRKKNATMPSRIRSTGRCMVLATTMTGGGTMGVCW